MPSGPRMARLVRALIFVSAFISVSYLSSLRAQVPDLLPQHELIHVSLSRTFAHPVSGRLLLFLSHSTGESRSVDVDMMSPTSTYVAAKELEDLKPGETVDIDLDDIVFPKPVSQASAGAYNIQAVLDVNHSYNYDGRSAGDLVSSVVVITLPMRAMQTPSLTLSEVVPEPPDPLSTRPDVEAALKPLDIVSPALSRFWGREIHMRGLVLLPPDYDGHRKDRFPTVYFTHGFGGTLQRVRARYAPILYDRMKQGKMPPMIWVLLDESSPTGTHEFANSVNNGPWGTALTTELIPKVETQYRMDARTSGRFLQGHSSGGWATLWLQTHYPKVFGGTWSTSPDPSDFHCFSTVDMYASHANMYTARDGTPNPIMRVRGEPAATFEQLARMELVLGPYGGQIASFEWVFSPRGSDGRPQPVFDRVTGEIDPAVAASWRDHFDIVHYIKDNRSRVGSDLQGKIHLFVGTDDTFYLDRAAHSLQATLDELSIKSEFVYVPGRSHFNLYADGNDNNALFDRIAAEMYKVARPQSHWSKSR